MATYMPPGWPAGVHPPGSEDFESTAVGWLLDVVPPDYRLHGVLRRYPVALAAMARYHSRACVEGARQGYRTARTELAGALPPHAVDTVLAAYRKEGARLAATARAVGLVERALHGEVFTPKMSASTPTPALDRGTAAAAGPDSGATGEQRQKAAEPRTAEPRTAEPRTAEPRTAEPRTAEPRTAEPRQRSQGQRSRKTSQGPRGRDGRGSREGGRSESERAEEGERADRAAARGQLRTRGQLRSGADASRLRKNGLSAM